MAQGHLGAPHSAGVVYLMPPYIISDDLLTELADKTIQILKEHTQMKGVYFVSGIDTDIGKTVATGMLANNCCSRAKA